MTGSVCSFFIFCFILLLHLYPRKGTEALCACMIHMCTQRVAPLPPQGDGSIVAYNFSIKSTVAPLPPQGDGRFVPFDTFVIADNVAPLPPQGDGNPIASITSPLPPIVAPLPPQGDGRLIWILEKLVLFL